MEISIYLCNPGKYTDQVIFEVENADNVSVKLLAVGVGTSILAEPELKTELYLGILLTRRKFFYPLKFTNKGFRLHKIRWSNKKTGKSSRAGERRSVEEVYVKRKGFSDFGDFNRCFRPTFDLKPDSYELATNNSVTVNLVACHHEESVQEEDFYCHAMIQGQKDKRVIMNTHVSATFVDPTVELSKKVLNFRMDIGPNDFIDCTLKGKQLTIVFFNTIVGLMQISSQLLT